MKTKIIIGSFLIIFFSCNSTEFNSGSWKKGDKELRGKMSSDLIQKQILYGKSENDVIELLGTPDRKNQKCVTYDLDLGGYNEMVNWNYFLQICFDKRNGKSNYVQIND